MILNPNELAFLPVLEVASEVLLDFNCGVASLNAFLTEDSQAFHSARISSTRCVFHPDFDGMVGYISMSNDAIILKDSEKFDLGLGFEVTLSSFPALKIGKFAVREELCGCGNGKAIMNIVLKEIADSYSSSAARVIVVDAIPSAVNFYTKLGFLRSLYAESRAAANNRGRGRSNQSTTVKLYRDALSLTL